MDNLELLNKDIAKIASQDVSAHPEWDDIVAKLDTFRIRRDQQLPEAKHLIEIDGVKCMPRGDLIAISGKEKCGKTTACRILTTILLRGEYEGMKALESNLRILWIDTEQAAISTRSVVRALDMMCGFEVSDDQLFMLNLREWGDKDTIKSVLEVTFDSFRPDFVILDGIRDFIYDFNDVKESAAIVLDVMRLSSGVSAVQARALHLHERMPCCIACILHQNKPKDDNNMRGHLGTELANKSGEVWESSREEEGLFKFTQTRSRTRPLEEAIAFKVRSKNYIDSTGSTEEIGIPEIWQKNMPMGEVTAMIRTKDDGEFPATETNILWMFWNFMRNQGFRWNDLVRLMCDRYGIAWTEFMGLKKQITPYLVKDDIDQLWHYQGPVFDEPGECS